MHSGIFLVRYRTEIMDAGRNADAGVSFLDTDAQLWLAGRGEKRGSGG
jgi:hypothetical protein